MSRQIEESKHELARVIDLLSENIHGLSITDISRLLNMNRNSVSKYLNMLLISGHVDMMSIGVAKVYLLSHRVPISAMLDFSSDAIIVLNSDQRVVQANDNFLTFSGYDIDEIRGLRLPESALPVVSNVDVIKAVAELLKEPRGGKEIEWEDDSGNFYFLVKLIPTVFDDGSPGITIILEDVTAAKKALRDKDELIDEIHLRVRNNLQLISSLLSIQCSKFEDKALKAVMNDAERRLAALSLVHECVTGTVDRSHINAGKYLGELVELLRKAMEVSPEIKVLVDANDVLIPFEAAIPFGLMMNELLVNSFMHAFDNGAGGVVRVILERRPKGGRSDNVIYSLKYSDNGCGLPEGINPETSETLGFSLIRNLLERELSGLIEKKESTKGVMFEITFVMEEK